MSRVQHGSIIIHLTLCHRCSHHAILGAIHSRDLSLAYLSIRSWRSRTVACPSGREWEFPLRSDIQLCRSSHFDERKNACFLSRRFRLYILPDREISNCSTFLKFFSKNFYQNQSIRIVYTTILRLVYQISIFAWLSRAKYTNGMLTLRLNNGILFTTKQGGQFIYGYRKKNSRA